MERRKESCADSEIARPVFAADPRADRKRGDPPDQRRDSRASKISGGGEHPRKGACGGCCYGNASRDRASRTGNSSHAASAAASTAIIHPIHGSSLPPLACHRCHPSCRGESSDTIDVECESGRRQRIYGCRIYSALKRYRILSARVRLFRERIFRLQR